MDNIINKLRMVDYSINSIKPDYPENVGWLDISRRRSILGRYLCEFVTDLISFCAHKKGPAMMQGLSFWELRINL